MATETQDAMRVIVHALANSAALTAIVASRIYGGSASTPDQKSADYPRLTLPWRGGHRNGYSPVREYVFEAISWSRTSADEALSIQEVVLATLQVERLTVSDITTAVLCRQTSQPSIGYDEQARAWYASTRWVAQAFG